MKSKTVTELFLWDPKLIQYIEDKSVCSASRRKHCNSYGRSWKSDYMQTLWPENVGFPSYCSAKT